MSLLSLIRGRFGECASEGREEGTALISRFKCIGTDRGFGKEEEVEEKHIFEHLFTNSRQRSGRKVAWTRALKSPSQDLDRTDDRK